MKEISEINEIREVDELATPDCTPFSIAKEVIDRMSLEELKAINSKQLEVRKLQEQKREVESKIREITISAMFDAWLSSPRSTTKRRKQ